MTIKAIQEELIEEFAMFDDWMQRYEYMIDLGKSLPLIDEQNKTDKIIIDKTPVFTTTQFKCSKCKNNECKTYSLQTRSADETTTIFVNCIKCNNTWKMS